MLILRRSSAAVRLLVYGLLKSLSGSKLCNLACRRSHGLAGLRVTYGPLFSFVALECAKIRDLVEAVRLNYLKYEKILTKEDFGYLG